MTLIPILSRHPASLWARSGKIGPFLLAVTIGGVLAIISWLLMLAPAESITPLGALLLRGALLVFSIELLRETARPRGLGTQAP